MSFLHLQYTRSDGEIDTYHLKAGTRYHVGRGSTCEVRILDMRLSRQHCAFETDGDDWMLVDLGSTNGCAIGENKVSDRLMVAAHSKVTLGSVELFISAITKHLQDTPTELHNVIVSSADIQSAEAKMRDTETENPFETDAFTPTDAVVEPVVETEKVAINTDTEKEVDAHTVFITALGKKSGPFTRSQARDIKRMELKGQLTQEKLDDFAKPSRADA